MAVNTQIDAYKLLKNFIETLPCGVYIKFREKDEYINEILTKWIGRDKAKNILKNKSGFNSLFKQGKDFSDKLESISVGDNDKKFMIKKASGYGIYRITVQMFDSYGIEALAYFFEDITDLHFAEINVESSQSYIDNLIKSKTSDQEAPTTQITEDPMEMQKKALKALVDTKAVNVCTFMSSDDIEDLEDILSTVFVLMNGISDNMPINMVHEISALLMRFGKILAVYNETYKIAFAIQLVAREIEHNATDFIKKAAIVRSPMYYFYADLETWVRKLFREGVTSVNFMNDSIVCNSYQIIDIFKHSDEMSTEEMFF